MSFAKLLIMNGMIKRLVPNRSEIWYTFLQVSDMHDVTFLHPSHSTIHSIMYTSLYYHTLLGSSSADWQCTLLRDFRTLSIIWLYISDKMTNWQNDGKRYLLSVELPPLTFLTYNDGWTSVKSQSPNESEINLLRVSRECRMTALLPTF